MPTLAEIQECLKSLDGASAFFGKKEIKELPNILWENELPRKIIQGAYNNSMGILVCTDSRLIFVDKGLLYGVKVEDFPLKSISSIQYETGLVFGEVTIFASGNKATIKQVDKEQARNFAEFVRAKISNTETTKAVPTQPSPTHANAVDDMIGQLERLAALKEKGILTEEEFASQKAKILQLLS